MFKPDTIFKDTLERSVNSYLDEMLEHEDLSVRSGVKATQDYIQMLKDEINYLTEKNQLKDEYLKKLKNK